MEGADDLYKSRWASKLAEYRPECSSVHSVEWLGEIDEEQVEVLVLLDTFFLELPDSKDHIHRAPLLSEATLALRHNIIQYVLGDPVQHDTGQYLACNAEEADPAVVVAGWAITLGFVQVDDVGIPEVPWELAIDPEHLEHPGKVSDKGFTTGFEHLGWYSIWSRSLACLQLFDGCINLCCVRWGIKFWDHGALLNGLQCFIGHFWGPVEQGTEVLLIVIVIVMTHLWSDSNSNSNWLLKIPE